MRAIYYYVAGAILLFALCCILLTKKREGLSLGSELVLKAAEDLHYKPGFLPSHQGPQFQGMPPSLRVENNYHKCILAHGGDYGNYELKQKCYISTLKDGTYDKNDLMCWRERNNEKNYFRCLSYYYGGGNNWADRGSSTEHCLCPGNESGAFMADGECFCPSRRPLHDRREVDENDDIIHRI